MAQRKKPADWKASVVFRCNEEWKRLAQIFAREEAGMKLSVWLRYLVDREMKKGKAT